ncbi:DUF1028 domain-containing protein [Acinetobacter qingfengensis]|uniref:Fimbrial assembly protein FimA n=1 Tax=Acinetobacter qingfengensis TaxID=1262585 RepID=A0A1E7REN0_9GAMM|nr:DUF1028 domain-containing protein [Acinetobacter qingfengensis]KAA8735694.1 DUF1028 domain-containing protein [Acinetobacter qingfengensis]OEY97860.1 fimbrial assembly protein FimA [Acinetobacter qingfengensis]
MTFSIVARCKTTGQMGAAVSSSSPAVAARCIRARAGVGVASSQNITDPHLAQILLDLIKYDVAPDAAIQELVSDTDFIEYRQLLVLNTQGQAATYSGEKTLGVYQSHIGQDVACAGNLLANPEVPKAMCLAFEQSQGCLAERLLLAMQAGLTAGGEAGNVHSAGLLVVDKVPWPIVDLRVDWTDKDPIAELYSIWKIYKPQVEDYVLRALNPSSSPSYGVPGDP